MDMQELGYYIYMQELEDTAKKLKEEQEQNKEKDTKEKE